MLAIAGAVVVAAPVVAASLPDGVLAELNFARTQPQNYAGALRAYRQKFRGNVVEDRREGVSAETAEGVRAVDDAIAFLERQGPLPPLSRGDVLAVSARDHAAAQGKRGDVGHLSADGATPGQRAVRRGGGIYVSETISYGSATPVSVVRQFIVDDGVADRSHRRLIFTPKMRFAGVGCGKHRMFGTVCVVDFSASRDGKPVAGGR
ncbi:serine protease [Polymorphobacter glacialis]|uniref:Serine protease n=2 Tax=Sandarakinorhabdus glacialis TaxID=1614636 RepID=A0A917EAF0_9SPHN|nr:serine protease [Polymorphobacter glacialis]